MGKIKDDKIFNTYSQIKVKCKICGHVNTMPVFVDVKDCWFCHNKMHNNTSAYFKYKMRKEIERNDKNE